MTFDAIVILGLLGSYLITVFVLCVSFSTDFCVLLFKRDFCSSDYQTFVFRTCHRLMRDMRRGSTVLKVLKYWLFVFTVLYYNIINYYYHYYLCVRMMR